VVFDAWLGLAADVVPARSCQLSESDACATASEDLDGCTLPQWNEQCSSTLGSHVRALQEREPEIVNGGDVTAFDSRSAACSAASLGAVLGAFAEDVTLPFTFTVRALLTSLVHSAVRAAPLSRACIAKLVKCARCRKDQLQNNVHAFACNAVPLSTALPVKPCYTV
jgi:hypothetical protein